MQDFFFYGLISAIALGMFIFKGIMFVIHMVHVKESDAIIDKNLARIEEANHQVQQIQKTVSSIENVVDWKYDDPRFLSEDLMRQQFLVKSKPKKAQMSDYRASPREKIPLATTDFDEFSDDDGVNAVPIYTYNPSVGGTQV